MILKIINKIKNIIKLARVVSVDDSKKVRIGVVQYLGKEQQVTIFTPYGFMHNPPENSFGPIWQINGEESKMIGMFDRTDQRPVKELASGEVAVGNYSTGDYIIFKENGDVDLNLTGDVTIKIDSGTNLVLANKDSNATLTLGDGAKSVAEADTLQSLYTSLKSYLDAHIHPDPVSGVTGVPTTIAPSWDSNINSNKAKIPSN